MKASKKSKVEKLTLKWSTATHRVNYPPSVCCEDKKQEEKEKGGQQKKKKLAGRKFRRIIEKEKKKRKKRKICKIIQNRKPSDPTRNMRNIEGRGGPFHNFERKKK